MDLKLMYEKKNPTHVRLKQKTWVGIYKIITYLP